mmetsp:Transcript_36284/g.94356  ORF Transcript_36284/g.94356 Transcript_36284/m.94356 type:complete len:490 (-) Transcript_36284:519-1988(-)
MDVTLPSKMVKNVAESVGVSSDRVEDDVASRIAQDATYRLREVITDAIKFMQHSKRHKLTTDDMEAAFRIRNVKGIYGHHGEEDKKFVQVPTMNDMFVLDEKDIDFKDLSKIPLPEIPLEPDFFAHWLAVEGVQPDIVQNPGSTVQEAQTEKKEKKKKLFAQSLPAQPLVDHVVPKELQLYYERAVESLTSADDGIVNAVIESLQSEPGLHQLLPYFVQFFKDQVVQKLTNLPRLVTVIRSIRALFDNKYLNVEPYLDQIMPVVLTCLVGKKLCSSPEEDHWALRTMTGNLLGLILNRFGKRHISIIPRVTKTLFHAFMDVKKPLTTHFGAFTGLFCIGQSPVRTLILPNLKPYMKVLEKSRQGASEEKKREIERVHTLLKNGVCRFFREEGIARAKPSTEVRAAAVAGGGGGVSSGEAAAKQGGGEGQGGGEKMEIEDASPSTTAPPPTTLEMIAESPLTHDDLVEMFGPAVDEALLGVSAVGSSYTI